MSCTVAVLAPTVVVMADLLLATAAGFGTGLSLIVAIGSQNAFVLRQGIRREAVPVVVAVCIGSDALLICLGVGGVGTLISSWPAAVSAVAVVGGFFLLGYGALAARRAIRPAPIGPGAIQLAGDAAGSRHRALVTSLALTWLNPHVYLDTVLLLGAVAAGHGARRWDFAVGAVLASACWFVVLGFGARLLSGFFTRRSSWRALDALVAATMLTVGLTLLTTA
jgi:L-lysine exporter family protein LysE/ArgO